MLLSLSPLHPPSRARSRSVVTAARLTRALLAGLAAVGTAAVSAGAAGATPPRALRLGTVEIYGVDGAGRVVDLGREGASIQRTPPSRLPDDPLVPTGDPDELRLLVVGPPDDLPASLAVASIGEGGDPVDSLGALPLTALACPAELRGAAGRACGVTLPVRAVADDIDRQHPLVRERSIKAELGGALLVRAADAPRESSVKVAVGGPRRTELGALAPLRAHLRVHLVRVRKGGPAPIGGDDDEAVEAARAEIRRASSLWGSCGIGFDLAQTPIHVVDPPGPWMISLGCDVGLPATGGRVAVRVDGKPVELAVPPGTTARAAARLLAARIERLGLQARVSDNAAIGPGVASSSDVLVRRRDGSLATVAGPSAGPVSTDATLTACIGGVDLEDGLQHFTDVDAIAGTVEERALVKAFDDGDPATVEVVVVPSFAGGSRIGESFIDADGGAIRNVVLEDRGGFRADRASFTLAHELGHVLLDQPGHPDDYGVDTPTQLMDADAANATAFGPRRLSLAECERALRQSGPTSPTGLLGPWEAAPTSAVARSGAPRPPRPVGPATPGVPRGAAAPASGAKGRGAP